MTTRVVMGFFVRKVRDMSVLSLSLLLLSTSSHPLLHLLDTSIDREFNEDHDNGFGAA